MRRGGTAGRPRGCAVVEDRCGRVWGYGTAVTDELM